MSIGVRSCKTSVREIFLERIRMKITLKERASKRKSSPPNGEKLILRTEERKPLSYNETVILKETTVLEGA